MSETLIHPAAVITDRGGVRTRLATPDDILELVRLEQSVWEREGLQGATAEQLESRLRTFPAGTIVATNSLGIQGLVTVHIVHYDLHQPMETWYEATDDGYAGNHDPSGNMAYGTTLTISQLAPRDVCTALLVAAGRVVVRHGLDGIIVGSRIPRYEQYALEMVVNEYVRLSLAGEKSFRGKDGQKRKIHPDPEIVIYQRHGLKHITTLPDYFNDPASLSHGVIMMWENYFRRLPFPSLWAKLLTMKTAQGWRGFLPQT